MRFRGRDLPRPIRGPAPKDGEAASDWEGRALFELFQHAFQADVVAEDPEDVADVPCNDFYISRVIQKAKMTVAEWGTEAAAVTVVEMAERSALPGKAIPFVADHPFVFVLGEHDTGTILFEGIYLGE